jgi:inorganic pyrophosphatase
MVLKIFVEAEAGSCEKRRYDEKTLEYQGVRRASLSYPYPYGFIMNTETEDGDGIDAYILTKDDLKAGQMFECEPVGMLEVFEGDEIDHKVLAGIPGQTVEIDGQVLEVLQDFIYRLFKPLPQVKIKVGRCLSKQEAVEYIEKQSANWSP